MSVPEIPGLKAEEDLARSFRHEVAQLLKRNVLTFPGAQPVSFARKHLTSLCVEDYFLCEKTDGIRCLLYCTEDSGAEIHYLIDRKNDYYFVQGLHLPHHADPTFRKFHTGTLLDGELVLDKLKDGTRKLRYLVFDLIALDGELITMKTFDKRIGRIMEFVQKPLNKLYQRFPEDCADMPFELRMKLMDKPYALDDMFKLKLPNLPHGNDGLIFTAKNAFYTFGTDEMILKWKPPNENTIDFKLKIGQFPVHEDPSGGPPIEDFDAKPAFELCIYWGSKDYRVYADLTVTDEEWEAMKRMGQELDGRVVECHIDESGQWRMKIEETGFPRFRDDKPEANHVSTLRKVMESIEDGVSETDLCAASGNIREAWKERHPEERKPNGH
jgi:mRNA guanylyltransferase